MRKGPSLFWLEGYAPFEGGVYVVASSCQDAIDKLRAAWCADVRADEELDERAKERALASAQAREPSRIERLPERVLS